MFGHRRSLGLGQAMRRERGMERVVDRQAALDDRGIVLVEEQGALRDSKQPDCHPAAGIVRSWPTFVQHMHAGLPVSSPGVLIFASAAERYVEVVADAGINDKVSPDVWDDAVHALVSALKDGRPADGFVAAIERCGTIFVEHFPPGALKRDELPTNWWRSERQQS